MGNLENAKAALEAVSVELTSLRDSQKAKLARISEIDKQIKALRDAPISLEDFHGYVAKHIESLGRVYGKQLQLCELVRPNRGGPRCRFSRSFLSATMDSFRRGRRYTHSFSRSQHAMERQQ